MITNQNSTETDVVTVKANPKNKDVKAVQFVRSYMHHIPNALFKAFSNLELLDGSFGLESIESEHFIGINKLKVFQWSFSKFEVRFFFYQWKINCNAIFLQILGPNTFSSAPHLEVIELKYGKLKSVHRLAFDGLNHVKHLILECKIKNLHPNTFSSLTKLEDLSLYFNICIDQVFKKEGFKMSTVQEAIEEYCDYDAKFDVNKN